MKLNTNNKCSRQLVEQYCLNQLDSEQETAFQEHLQHCETCRNYFNSIHTLAAFIGNEERAKLSLLRQRKKVKRYALYLRLSVAASVLLLVGLFIYFLQDNNKIPLNDGHLAVADTSQTIQQDTFPDTHRPTPPQEELKVRIAQQVVAKDTAVNRPLQIEHSHKAAGTLTSAETAVTLIFPKENISSVNISTETPYVVFTWSADAAFELVLKSDDKIVFEAKGQDTRCRISTALLKPYTQLDWQLILNSIERKGKLYLLLEEI